MGKRLSEAEATVLYTIWGSAVGWPVLVVALALKPMKVMAPPRGAGAEKTR